MSAMQFLSLTLMLLIVLDPVGLAIMTPSLLRHVPRERVTRVICREMIIALLVLLVFLFGGKTMLHVLGLETATLNISGAVVLFLIALGMVFPGIASATSSSCDVEEAHEPLIVPIAIPLFAGPGGIAVVMLHSAGLESMAETFSFAGCILAAWTCSLAIVLAGPHLLRRLGRRGSVALERLVGILLILISVQMFIDGLHDFRKPSSPPGVRPPAEVLAPR